jgi:poly-gamma-glutamate capsule biosynthesis protein CapA/YwtB (metallophosphatase superfamily)
MASIKLCLCGDIMTGRGIDQVLPHPGDPRLRESYVQSALRYVELAETANGIIEKPVSFAYIWGDALEAFKLANVRVVNLETSVTATCDYWPKSIHYRMNPANVACLTSVGIDCCVLANNHLMDCGVAGLAETVNTLRKAGIATAGAGHDLTSALMPAIKEVPGKGRVLVFGFGCESSGIPSEWAARECGPGVNLISESSESELENVAARVRVSKRPDDVVVASIHWGGNWGYQIPVAQRSLAHRMVDAGVDIVHGHSSHHPKAVEVYREKLILYGCGDFMNDYEGIPGYEQFRNDLALMYLPSIETPAGRLLNLTILPFQIRRFRLNHAAYVDAAHLRDILNLEGTAFDTHFSLTDGRAIELIPSKVAIEGSSLSERG